MRRVEADAIAGKPEALQERLGLGDPTEVLPADRLSIGDPGGQAGGGSHGGGLQAESLQGLAYRRFSPARIRQGMEDLVLPGSLQPPSPFLQVVQVGAIRQGPVKRQGRVLSDLSMAEFATVVTAVWEVGGDGGVVRFDPGDDLEGDAETRRFRGCSSTRRGRIQLGVDEE